MSKLNEKAFKEKLLADITKERVGKTSLLLRFSDDAFNGCHITTIGVDFKIRTLVIDEKRVKVQIWDTAGQERFRTITSTYYRGTHGVIVVYDVTDGGSFKNVRRWLDEIQNNCGVLNVILVGNKNDDPEKKVVATDDARRFAESCDIELFETSAKDNIGVNEMFHSITRQVLRDKIQTDKQEDEQKKATIKLIKSNKSKKRKCCR